MQTVGNPKNGVNNKVISLPNIDNVWEDTLVTGAGVSGGRGNTQGGTRSNGRIDGDSVQNL